ncbi:hypothetical protein WH5701_16233 [Synechococcus sp. WH 5701]|nr:hypothetical protein WH5701_16233 [Synechococcus sp. WH 5701]
MLMVRPAQRLQQEPLQGLLFLVPALLRAAFFSPWCLILFAACRVGMMKTTSKTKIAFGSLLMAWEATMPLVPFLRDASRRLSACP